MYQSDLQQYRSACRKLWAMGLDVPRVTSKHPYFIWGTCRLMENGDLRIAGNKEHPRHDKLVRKTQNDKIVYKRISISGQTYAFTDARTIREMDEVYEMLIDYENIALKYGMPFPLNISSGINLKPTATSYQISRSTFSTISLPKASVASAPSTMYTTPSRSQPLLPVENIRRNLSNGNYEFKEDGKQKCFHVVEKSTGYSIRTSTGNMEQAIFRRSKNGPEAGRFFYRNPNEVPRDAVGLVNELIIQLAKRKA